MLRSTFTANRHGSDAAYTQASRIADISLSHIKDAGIDNSRQPTGYTIYEILGVRNPENGAVFGDARLDYLEQSIVSVAKRQIEASEVDPDLASQACDLIDGAIYFLRKPTKAGHAELEYRVHEPFIHRARNFRDHEMLGIELPPWDGSGTSPGFDPKELQAACTKAEVARVYFTSLRGDPEFAPFAGGLDHVVQKLQDALEKLEHFITDRDHGANYVADEYAFGERLANAGLAEELVKRLERVTVEEAFGGSWLKDIDYIKHPFALLNWLEGEKNLEEHRNACPDDSLMARYLREVASVEEVAEALYKKLIDLQDAVEDDGVWRQAGRSEAESNELKGKALNAVNRMLDAVQSDTGCEYSRNRTTGAITVSLVDRDAMPAVVGRGLECVFDRINSHPVTKKDFDNLKAGRDRYEKGKTSRSNWLEADPTLDIINSSLGILSIGDKNDWRAAHIINNREGLLDELMALACDAVDKGRAQNQRRAQDEDLESKIKRAQEYITNSLRVARLVGQELTTGKSIRQILRDMGETAGFLDPRRMNLSYLALPVSIAAGVELAIVSGVPALLNHFMGPGAPNLFGGWMGYAFIGFTALTIFGGLWKFLSNKTYQWTAGAYTNALITDFENGKQQMYNLQEAPGRQQMLDLFKNFTIALIALSGQEKLPLEIAGKDKTLEQAVRDHFEELDQAWPDSGIGLPVQPGVNTLVKRQELLNEKAQELRRALLKADLRMKPEVPQFLLPLFKGLLRHTGRNDLGMAIFNALISYQRCLPFGEVAKMAGSDAAVNILLQFMTGEIDEKYKEILETAGISFGEKDQRGGVINGLVPMIVAYRHPGLVNNNFLANIVGWVAYLPKRVIDFGLRGRF